MDLHDSKRESRDELSIRGICKRNSLNSDPDQE